MDWASLIISIIAVVVAFVIPVYLLKWVRPDMKICFVSGGSTISIQIQNLPHNDGLCRRFFGERNSVQKLMVTVTVMNVPENGTILFDYQGDLKFGQEKFGHKEIVLPASPLSAQILIAGIFADILRNQATLFHEEQWTALSEGRYRVDISVCADSELLARRKDFVVRTDERKNTILEWIEERCQNAR